PMSKQGFMSKTNISPQLIEPFLKRQYGKSYEQGSLTQLDEGLESQAFTFLRDEMLFVLRLNQSDIGFEKDKLCYQTFQQLPIPEIVEIGQFDAQTIYCVSQWVAGETLQALNVSQLESYLQPT